MAIQYLAVGPHCWGKADTQKEAVKLARQNWPRSFSKVKRPNEKHFSIYSSEGEFTIDGMGYVSSTAAITKLQTSSLAT